MCTSYPNGMVSEQLYDAYDNLTDIQTADGTSPAPACNPSSITGTPTGTVFQNNAYTYAANSDLAQSQTITQSGTSTAWNYYYDPLNRLLEAAGGSAGTYNYSYDGDGNLLTRTNNPNPTPTQLATSIQTATYNADNQLCWVYTGSSSNLCSSAPTGAYSPVYDNAGNLLTVGPSTATTTLQYNDQEQTDSINPYGAGAQKFGYRGKGQNDPFQIGTKPAGGAAPGLEENTLGISAQYPVSNSGSTPSSSYTYYTRAPDGTLLAERGGGGSTSADDYYYVQDANNSVVALTNSSDAVANTYTYDPYGITTGFTFAGSAAAPNSFGFDGGYYANCLQDTDCPSSIPSSTGNPSPTGPNGLILFGTRYYNPATATWTQPDPDAQSLAQDPTQADPYAYTGDDPINSVDASGECIIFSCADYHAVGHVVHAVAHFVVKHAGTVAEGTALLTCTVVSAGACGVLTVAAFSVATVQNATSGHFSAGAELTDVIFSVPGMQSLGVESPALDWLGRATGAAGISFGALLQARGQ